MPGFLTKKIIIASFILVLLFSAGFFGINFLNSGKIIYGLRIGGLKVGGEKFNKAKEILEQKISSFEQQKIKFIFQDKNWLLTPKEIGVIFETEKMIEEASSLGRGTNILTGLSEQFQSFIFRKEIPCVWRLDSEKFGEAIKLFSSIEKPAQSAELKYNPESKNFEIVAAEKGEAVDRQKLIADLEKNLSQFFNESIVLSLATDLPKITDEMLITKKAEADKILELSPLKIQTDGLEWSIDRPQMAEWITVSTSSSPEISITFDEEKIKDFLESLAPSINQEPVNAKLSLTENRVTAFSLAQDGRRLNIEQSNDIIKDKILESEKNIKLVVKITPPQITSANLETLGLNSLLGKGESNFAGSTKNRIHNITVGTAKLSGIMLKPGEEFSFTQFIGDIDEQAGYLPELVIKQNETIPEYGGGLCQISTTIFRAAVNSGLKITERHPHAFPVRYYNPAGFDATVYPPKPDLRFLNDTSQNILLQGKIKGTKLTFEIYGTPDGREIKIKGPTILESKPDGSMKTILTQEIWRNGQMERQDVFRSNYKSPNLFPTPSPSPTP